MVIAFGIGWELRKTTGMVGASQCYVYLFMAPSSSTISFSTIHYLGMRQSCLGCDSHLVGYK
jgi:hypothetical protein